MELRAERMLLLAVEKMGEREGTAVEVCRCLDVVDQLVGVSAS